MEYFFKHTCKSISRQATCRFNVSKYCTLRNDVLTAELPHLKIEMMFLSPNFMIGYLAEKEELGLDGLLGDAAT